MTGRELKGRHVAMIFGAAFAVIIGVNITLAVSAVRTFPGLEVKNSYVASQSFDADRAAQEALEWDVSAEIADERLILAFKDPLGTVAPEITKAELGRATERTQDRVLDFAFDGRAYVADVTGLAPGKWDLRLEALAEDGTVFRQRIVLRSEG